MDLEELIAGGIGFGLLLVSVTVLLGILVFSIVVAWQITARTGYPGVLGLLLFLPLANVVFLLVLAFGDWPIQKRLRRLEAELERRRQEEAAIPGAAPGPP